MLVQPAFGACAALLLASSSLAAQGTFEGMIEYRFQGMPGEMRYYQQGQKSRQEMQMQGTLMQVTIYDGATGTGVVLMPMQRQFTKLSVGRAGGRAGGGAGGGDDMEQAMAAQQGLPDEMPDFGAMKVTATGRRETVAGIACEHFVFRNAARGNETVDICGARGMGFMGGGGAAGMPLSTASFLALGASNAQLAKLAKEGFFPLKMTMAAPGSSVTWEVTKVERRKLPASLFTVPAGYTELGMPAVPPARQP